jgi:hypothetical protein
VIYKNDFNEKEDYYVVDFRNVFGVNIEFLKEHTVNIKRRMRLLPPDKVIISVASAKKDIPASKFTSEAT